ncbi:hypothetical protein G6F63_014791 [Rhizopus arrhizus]|nr:hypothetical protein G6F30_014068 [Rhizopus arrhizus]KAG1142297.1 hypothetical protein G6F36_015578 [Rhizopus arrhizus]KAG1319337.1 hypothetical protein G6F63_014791 [Rhizopus arrhizus]
MLQQLTKSTISLLLPLFAVLSLHIARKSLQAFIENQNLLSSCLPVGHTWVLTPSSLCPCRHMIAVALFDGVWGGSLVVLKPAAAVIHMLPERIC